MKCINCKEIRKVYLQDGRYRNMMKNQVIDNMKIGSSHLH
jgi:hypothetical protein